MWIPARSLSPEEYMFYGAILIIFLAIVAIVAYIILILIRKSISKGLSRDLPHEEKAKLFRALREEVDNPPKCPKCGLPALYFNTSKGEFRLDIPHNEWKIIRKINTYCLKCDLGMKG